MRNQEDIEGIIMKRDIQTGMKEVMSRDGEQIMEIRQDMIIWIEDLIVEQITHKIIAHSRQDMMITILCQAKTIL